MVGAGGTVLLGAGGVLLVGAGVALPFPVPVATGCGCIKPVAGAVSPPLPGLVLLGPGATLVPVPPGAGLLLPGKPWKGGGPLPASSSPEQPSAASSERDTTAT